MKTILLFFLGASIGSFLGVVVDRFPHTSLIAPASHCTNCKKRLKPRDLIPIFSQVLAKSKCRYCQSKIPYWYAILEALCGFLLVLVGYHLLSLLEVVLILAGLVLSIYDIKHREYPLAVWAVFTFVALLFSSLNPVFLLFLLLAYCTETYQWKIGSGDFLFLASLALLFPLREMLWIIQISSILGILVFFVFSLKKALPFVPFLLIAALLVRILV